MPELINDKKKVLYDAVSKDYNIGTFDEFSKKLEDPTKRKLFYEGVGKEYQLGTFQEFENKITPVKKKADSSSSLDISAGPYASGQKPKGFGDIVSEKISEVTPKEEKQAKEQVVANKKKEAYQKDNSYGQQAMDYLGSGIMSTIDVLAIGGLNAIDIIKPYGEIGEDKTINKAIDKIKEANVSLTKETQERDALQPYNGSPSDAFMAGDWGSVAKLTGLKVLNSIPTSVAIGSNPAVATSWVMGNVSNEYTKLVKEGYTPKQAAIDASINTSTEFFVDRMFGGAKQLKTLFKEGGKEAVKKHVLSELGKTATENIGGEQVENIISNLSKKYVLGKENQDLFEGAGDTFWSSLGTSAMYSPLTVLNTAKNNLLAKEQEQQGTPTVSEEQQNQLNTMPNKPQLPPDEGGASGGNLMTPEGMQQAGVESPEQTQLAQANQVIQEVINNDNVATSIEGQPVDIKELTPEGVVLIDGQVVPVESVMVESELGTNPLVDVINEYINQQENAVQIESTSSEVPLNGETGQTIPQGSEGVRQGEQGVETTQQGGQEKVTVVPELPKKIFHATNAQFEGQPSRQEQSKVSAFGTEPAGLFYSTNPDQAKQAIGNGENARIVEADFNTKNPLVINNINDDTYFNTLNESKQQAIQELSPEYNEAGVDLTTLEEGEIPEAVNKRTSEIFAEKLKEQGFDAVVNNENGDIIILDDSVVADITNKSTSPTNEIEKSQQIQELKDELDALDAQDDSKLTEKEKKRIKNAIRHTVTSIARGYFLDGGKILWDSLKKETGFKGGEFKDFLGIVSKTGRTVDGIANYLWENRDNDQFETDDYRNAIIEILSEPRDEWYVRQRNEVDADSNQNVFKQKQKIQEQIDILEDSDLSFEDIKNELEANEAMWEQKFKSEGNPKQKSGTFVNKELESDIPKVIEYLAKMKELEDGTKKRNIQTKIDEITSKDAKLKKIIENFDVILKQLNYTSDC